MAKEYSLQITGEELEERLNKIDEISEALENNGFIQIIRLEEDD